MTPKEFIIKNRGYAKTTEEKTGIPWSAILTMAALESGWGKAAPGFSHFGVKDFDGKNGNEQLLRTTEYSRRSDLKFPEIISITPVIRNGQKYFKYVIRDWFRKYNTPEESFTDHANFLKSNKRYNKALGFTYDARLFLNEVAAAGYATDPEYAKKLGLILDKIEKICKELDA